MRVNPRWRPGLLAVCRRVPLHDPLPQPRRVRGDGGPYGFLVAVQRSEIIRDGAAGIGIVRDGGQLPMPQAEGVEVGRRVEQLQRAGSVEKALRKYFGKRGEQVVQDNLNCVKRGYSEMQEISPEIMNLSSNGHV